MLLWYVAPALVAMREAIHANLSICERTIHHMTSLERLADAVALAPKQTEETTLDRSWLLGFDTETTGTFAGKDAIVSATLVLRNPEMGSEGDVVAEWLINPHRPMNPRASQINSFTDAYLQEHGQEPERALSGLAAVITQAQSKRIPLLAYNAPFDVHMLNGDLRRWSLDTLDEREAADNTDYSLLVVDPLVLDRAVSRRSGRRNLASTTEYYGVEPQGDFHDATADTVAAVDLIGPMTTLYPQLGRLSMGELMDWQRQAHATWQESFNRWLQGRGRAPIHDSWL
ncbi:DNA polymerase III epsilon subunit-like 3'-5' exonuclease [Bifidobacterium tsurumiense]|uniref:DNA polymerase III epsilon subunit-like 3'-5' exonuclease n=2 Tax=Bifidobacterium tsurumiense TaxID=356829 RepID=A0A087EJR0_9BIFI|nr:DNA polymerase III epsilon subunit-like 3'-5' exonuclease [Bifidobacterium tsurumiense]